MCKKSSTFAPDFERRITLPGWRNGRRGRLKICCPQGRVGSIPTPGTKRNKSRDLFFFFVFFTTNGGCIGCRRFARVASLVVSALVISIEQQMLGVAGLLNVIK